MQNEDKAAKKHDPAEVRWPGKTALPFLLTNGKSNFDLATIQMPTG